MSKFRFELNRSGVRELLKGDAMQAHLQSIANKAQTSLGEGYESDVYVGKNRANSMVWAETFDAKRENSKTNSILKAVMSNGS